MCLSKVKKLILSNSGEQKLALVSKVLSQMWKTQTPCVTFYCKRIFQPVTDSADNQSAAGALLRLSMKGVRRRDRGYLSARAWFHGIVCSRPIGAGDLRMREESGGEGKREGKAPMEKCPGLG